MLFYTSKNKAGKVHATYSGRFAYMFSGDQGDYKAIGDLRKGDDMAALWTNQRSSDSNAAIRILAHEYTHKKIYTLSESGLILNGYRYWVRTRFLLFNDCKCVRKYYRMRTVHLMETLSYHEELSRRIDEDLKSSPIDIKAVFEEAVIKLYSNRIQDAEDRIATKWESMGLKFNGLWRKHYRKLGIWFHENFSVRISGMVSDEQYLWEVFADRGIANDPERIRPGEPAVSRMKKTVLSILFRHPLYFTESFRRRFEWYWIGQRTQFATLKEMYGMDHPSFLKEIMHPSMLFVMEWSGVPLHARGRLIEMAEDTLLMDRATFIRRWTPSLKQWSSDPNITRYFVFFHLHGN